MKVLFYAVGPLPIETTLCTAFDSALYDGYNRSVEIHICPRVRVVRNSSHILLHISVTRSICRGRNKTRERERHLPFSGLYKTKERKKSRILCRWAEGRQHSPAVHNRSAFIRGRTKIKMFLFLSDSMSLQK